METLTYVAGGGAPLLLGVGSGIAMGACYVEPLDVRAARKDPASLAERPCDRRNDSHWMQLGTSGADSACASSRESAGFNARRHVA